MSTTPTTRSRGSDGLYETIMPSIVYSRGRPYLVESGRLGGRCTSRSLGPVPEELAAGLAAELRAERLAAKAAAQAATRKGHRRPATAWTRQPPK